MRTRNKILSAILLLSFAFVIAISCEKDPFPVSEYGRIKGVVTDGKTLTPLKGVTVSTNPGSSTAVTNDKGEYTLENVKIGTVTINAEKANYTTYSAQIEVRKDITSTANISMQQSTSTIGAVTLTGSIPDSNAVDVKPKITISWKVTREAPLDAISYKITLKEVGSNIEKVFNNITDTALVVQGLKFSTKYAWKVAAVFNNSVVDTSTTWTFTTMTKPNMSVFFSRSSSNGLYQIIATDPDSTYEEVITENYEKTAFAPVAYKNQNLILFTSYYNNLPYVFGIFRDGTGVMKISPYPNMSAYSIGNGYSFYNHGNSLLYTYMDRLYAINTDGTNNRQIATAPTNRQFTNVDWCPETGKIVVRTVGPMPYESEFYTMDNDGSNMQLLIGGVTGMLETPSFSPDGKYLVYSQDVSGILDISGQEIQSHIFLKNLTDNSTPVDLTSNGQSNTSNGSNDLYPRFAPDSRQIIFVNRPNLGTAIGNIYKTDIYNGGRTSVVTNGTFPFWSL
jgi:Periplasmic component of the Tol biopolymer transport system